METDQVQERLTDGLIEAQRENENLQKINSSLTGQIDYLSGEVDKISTIVNRLIKENTDLKKTGGVSKEIFMSVENNHNKDIEALQSEISKLNSMLHKKAGIVIDLEKENQRLTKLTFSYENFQQENELLKKQMGPGLADQIITLMKENEELTYKYQNLDERHDVLKRQLKKENKACDMIIEDLKKENEHLKRDITALEEINNLHKKTIQELRNQFDDYDKELELLKFNNKELRDLQDSWAKENRELKEAHNYTIDQLRFEISKSNLVKEELIIKLEEVQRDNYILKYQKMQIGEDAWVPKETKETETKIPKPKDSEMKRFNPDKWRGFSKIKK